MKRIPSSEYSDLNNGYYKVIWDNGVSFFKITGKSNYDYNVYIYHSWYYTGLTDNIKTSESNYTGTYGFNHNHKMYSFEDEDELLREIVIENI